MAHERERERERGREGDGSKPPPLRDNVDGIVAAAGRVRASIIQGQTGTPKTDRRRTSIMTEPLIWGQLG